MAFSKVSAGDVLLISRGVRSTNVYFDVVAYLSRTRIKTKAGRYFRRDSGLGVGGNSEYIDRVVGAEEMADRNAHDELACTVSEMLDLLDLGFSRTRQNSDEIKKSFEKISKIMSEVKRSCREN